MSLHYAYVDPETKERVDLPGHSRAKAILIARAVARKNERALVVLYSQHGPKGRDSERFVYGLYRGKVELQQYEKYLKR